MIVEINITKNSGIHFANNITAVEQFFFLAKDG